jgi:hypothetical protein
MAIVLALVLGGAWWWSQPRIDPRLVGVWVNATPGEFSPIREFRSDGVEVHAMASSEILPTTVTQWNVAGDTLFFSDRTRASLAGTSFKRLWWELRNHLHGNDSKDEQYRIVEVGPDLLRIQPISKNPGSKLPIETYRRQPSNEQK